MTQAEALHLFPGEDLEEDCAEAARQWVGVYQELLDFRREVRALFASAGDRQQLEIGIRRSEHHLAFWRERLDELTVTAELEAPVPRVER